MTAPDPLVAQLTRMAIVLRAATALFVTAAALLGTAGARGPTVTALVVFDLATIGYVLTARAHGIGTPLVVADVAVVAGIALAMPQLLAAHTATSAAGWIFNAVSLVIIVAQLGGRPLWSLAAACGAIGAFLVGAAWVGAPDRGVTSAFTLALQVAITAGFVAILRRAGRQAAAAARGYHDTVRAQEAARLRRDAERTALTLLHNGPLTTLTLVAQGGLSAPTVAAVRAQAAVDLAVLAAETCRPGGGADEVPLAELLERTVAIIRHRLDVRLTAGPGRLPAAVARAIAGATAEALENVARHAGSGAARVDAECGGPGTRVTVVDAGHGFDPAGVPPNRFGLRESIRGELHRVGGRADVASHPGAGTTVTLVWPA